KKCLVLALLLCALLLFTPEACTVFNVRPEGTHCQDPLDKTWHAVGSQWRNSRCEDCNCSRCCPLAYPSGVPHDCVSVFDPEECKYTVHKKDDPSVLCPVRGYVGK
uniref:Beta-microseminoprotein n=1 Tax=Sparus aurata TaxID=8175 RepID=A0A671UJB8_SPAAU